LQDRQQLQQRKPENVCSRQVTSIFSYISLLLITPLILSLVYYHNYSVVHKIIGELCDSVYLCIMILQVGFFLRNKYCKWFVKVEIIHITSIYFYQNPSYHIISFKFIPTEDRNL